MPPRIAITVRPGELDKPDARAKYRRAVEQAGGHPVLVEPPQYLESVPDLVERFDGLLIPGGGDVAPELYGGREHESVEREPEGVDEFQLAAARAARAKRIPTLAICRGMQVINVALGGSLYEDIASQHTAPGGGHVSHRQTPDHARDETTHSVDITAGSKLASLVGATTLPVNTLHHQSVRRVAADLVPVASARDGVIEAVELQDGHPFYVGVQWHPEELAGRDEPSRALFRGFVEHAGARARARAARAS
jgi:putative glutamine amidotransferase